MSDYGIQIKGTSPIIEKRPTRPLSSQSPHLSVYKEGGDVEKRRKFGPKAPSKPSPKPGPHAPREPHKPDPKGGRPSPMAPQPKSPGPRRKPRKPKPKVEEDWAAEGGRIGFKKGGDSRWMQKATKSIKERGTKGKCTPITKPGCTGRAKALAKTFKKIAAKNKKA